MVGNNHFKNGKRFGTRVIASPPLIISWGIHIKLNLPTNDDLRVAFLYEEELKRR